MQERKREHPRGPISKGRDRIAKVYLTEDELMEIRIMAAKAKLSCPNYLRTIIGLEV